MSATTTRSRKPATPSQRVTRPEVESSPSPPPSPGPPSASSLPDIFPKSPVPFISQSQLITLIFIGAVVAHGTLYSSYHSLATSPQPSVSSALGGDLPPSSLPQSSSYFAQKGNFINQVFAKQAWAWTTGAFVLHLLTTPSFFSSLPFGLASAPAPPPKPTSLSSTSTRRPASQPLPRLPKSYLPTLPRLAKYLASTTFWILLTIWLAGPGLFERTMVWSGGECSIQLPVEMCGAVECTARSAVVVGQNSYAAGAKEVMLMTVPKEYCSARKPVTPTTFPALFPGWVEGEKHHRLHARWSGGHDISGHVFLLTLSALLLVDQTLPTIMILLEGGVDDLPWAHEITGLLGFGLAGLFCFILSKTAMYFHTPLEKATGFALAIVGLIITQAAGALTPQR